jgi:UTP:GlnB (protein PII) uridylyltransferase
MIYVSDQKELFASICGFFESISYDIHDAKIYTTRHGYALDTFQVHDPTIKRPQYRDIISYIEHELAARLSAQDASAAAHHAAAGSPAAPFSDIARGEHPARRPRHLTGCSR